MKSIIKLLFPAIILFAFTSCEEEYIPETSISEQEIVVEGYVEVGEGSNPTFVILTRSIPFISTMYAVLGFNPDSSSVDICVYADLFGQITKDYGRKYDLKVMVEGKTITASTTVPAFTGLSNFKWVDPPGTPSDTLAQLNVTIDDPAGIKNYYRYLTATGDDVLIPPFGSVTDDAIFDGKKFEFPLQNEEEVILILSLLDFLCGATACLSNGVRSIKHILIFGIPEISVPTAVVRFHLTQE